VNNKASEVLCIVNFQSCGEGVLWHFQLIHLNKKTWSGAAGEIALLASDNHQLRNGTVS